MRKTTETSPVWKTKDGRRIRICDITDEHLINCILLIDKTFDKARSVAEDAVTICCGGGEIAAETAENALDRIEEMDGPGDMWPIYNDLIAEKDKRFESRRKP